MSEKPAFRPRLLWILLGVLILVGVLPLVISHYVLIGINRDTLETLEKKYLTRSAVGIATDTESLINSYVQLLSGIGGEMKVAAESNPGVDPFVKGSDRLVSVYTSSDPNLAALRIVNQSGQGSAAQPATMSGQLTSELDAAVTVALHGKQYIGTMQTIDGSNQPGVVIAVPVIGANGVIGVVEALVNLHRLAEQLTEEEKADVSAFIVNREGRVLLHSGAGLSQQSLDFAYLPIVAEFMKAPVRLTQSYDDQVDGRKVSMIGTVAPIQSTNWGVVVQKKESAAYASVDQMVQRTIFWTAIAIGLAILLGSIFATRISQPIRMLADRTHDIADGHYEHRVEVPATYEMGELALNFNLMSGAIEKSIEQLKGAAQENNLLFINSIRMLAAAIDAKDPYTRGHSERVARYSIAIGKQLDLSQETMRSLRISALLHDVGKIGIDDRILRKPGALNEEEFDVMKTHPAKGASIMSGVAQLIDIVPGMKYHHEKWSGGGYPDGLEGESIPMQARIVAIADTFDAMTTNRPYQKAMDLTFVVEKIVSFGGNRFDPRVVDAFIRAVKCGDIQIEDQNRTAV